MHAPAPAAPLGVNAATAITTILTEMRNNSLIPPFPNNYQATLAQKNVTTADQLTLAEFSDILNELADQHFQNTGTRLQALQPLLLPFPIIFVNNPDANVTQVRARIKTPALHLAQRSAIRAGILAVTNLGNPADAEKQKLDKALSTMDLTTANQLTQNELQTLLTTLDVDGTKLQVKSSSAQPINITVDPAADIYPLVNSVRDAISAPALDRAARLDLRRALLSTVNADGPTRNAFDRRLSTMAVTQTDMQALMGILRINRGQNIRRGSAVVIHIPPSLLCGWGCAKEKSCCTNPFLFWSTEHKEITEQELPTITRSLLNSRGALRDRMANLDKAATLTGLLIGSLVLILELVRKSTTDLNAVYKLDLTLLILPGVLGLLSGIATYLRNQIKENLNENTRSLRAIDINPIDNDEPRNLAAVAPAPAP
jgi:hypothetical protein